MTQWPQIKVDNQPYNLMNQTLEKRKKSEITDVCAPWKLKNNQLVGPKATHAFFVGQTSETSNALIVGRME